MKIHIFIDSDNNLITKNPGTRKTTCKIVDFNHPKHQKAQKKRQNTRVRFREGGRTVGAGRVAKLRINKEIVADNNEK